MLLAALPWLVLCYVLYFKYLISILDATAHVLAHVALRLFTYRMKVVDHNLKLVFPEHTAARNAEIKFLSTKLALLNMFVGVHQRFLINEPEWLRAHVNDVPAPVFAALHQDYAEKNCILILPHFGMFYNMTSWYNVFRINTCITYKLDNKLVESLIFHGRQFQGKIIGVNHRVFKSYMKGLYSGAKAPNLLDNQTFTILCDQNSNKSNQIRFLNQTGNFHTTPAVVHKKTNRAIWAGFIRYDFKLKRLHHEMIPVQRITDDTDEAVITQRIADLFTERILAHPEQYFWLHNRFNFNPEA